MVMLLHAARTKEKTNMSFIDILSESGYDGMLVQVTGEPGTGKSRLALRTGAKISETAMLNADTKRALVNQIIKSGGKFGYYKDVLKETKGMKELQVFDFYLECLEEIEALPVENRKVLIFDPWELFEATLKPHVEKNSKKYKDFWSTMGAFKGPQQWNVSHELSARILSRCLGMSKIVILTSHLKRAYRGGVEVPGKSRPDNKKAIVKATDLRLWLRPNTIAIPVALVLKSGMMRVVMNEDESLDMLNVLPRKLTPQQGDEEIWDIIIRYWNEPFGTREPLNYERPDAFETSILEGTLTDEQKYAWKQAMKMKTAEDLELENEQVELVKRAVVLKGEGMSYLQISQELDIPIPRVIELLKQGETSE